MFPGDEMNKIEIGDRVRWIFEDDDPDFDPDERGTVVAFEPDGLNAIVIWDKQGMAVPEWAGLEVVDRGASN